VNKQDKIRIAQSVASTATLAVEELYAGLTQPDMTLLIFFCAPSYDLDLLAREIQCKFSGALIIGCTTAGEIGPYGYVENSLVGVSFSNKICQAVAMPLPDLQEFTPSNAYQCVQQLMHNLENKPLATPLHNSVGLLLIDGLSMREEAVTHMLQNVLGKIPLIGGSAGDGFRFKTTHVYCNDQFYKNSAVLLLLNTSLPFSLVKTQHFVPTSERMVVTAADEAHRVIYEINGRPASEEYARLAGVTVDALNPTLFAISPLVVVIDNQYYVRSIKSVYPGKGLCFYCAIEEGLVLRMVKGVDLLNNLELSFESVRNQIGPLELVLAFDCLLRKVEVTAQGAHQRLNQLLNENHVVGFNTYGEQYCGVHVNQTFIALAIGSANVD
jgi:hypothetical protein